MTALLEREVAVAMTLEDGASVRFGDGTVACVGRRAVRDGARVALLTVPGMVRLDLCCRADNLDFALRYLSGEEPARQERQRGLRLVETPEGELCNEYQIRFAPQHGPEVQIIVWLPEFRGQLVREHRAVALIHEG